MRFKKNCLIISIVAFAICIFAIADATTIKDDMTFEGPVTIAGAFTPSSMGTVTFTNGLTIDNATNNAFEWNENSEEILWTFESNALDLDSTSGVVTLNVFDGSTGTITHAADGAADDFTLSLTGAQDSSLIIASSGTAADAMQITASAGGIDISAGGAAAGEDIDITASSSVNVVSTEAAADQFKVDAQGAVAGNAINFETTDGGILLNADGAANGDIGIDAADDLTLTAAGDLTLAVTGTVSAGGSSITNVLYDSETVTEANVITASECGKTFFLNSATEFASTLPALSTVSSGCKMKFVINAAPSGADYTVITGNSLENQIYGLAVVNGATVAAADEDTITFADGAAVKGDWVEVESDGTSWYISGQGAAAGAITITQAD